MIIVFEGPHCPACMTGFPKRGPGKLRFPITSLCRTCGAHFIRMSPTQTRHLTADEWARHKLKWPKPPAHIKRDHDEICRRLWG